MSVTRELAQRIKSAYEEVSPYIEGYTSEVCPCCTSVCCIDRHGTYEKEDLAFLEALGDLAAVHPALEDDTQPCRHLIASGCSLPRWQRPFRCTWYFCQTLLETMPRKSPRRYREFIDALGRLQDLRRELYGACTGRAGRQPGGVP